jgi:hypothetical protein
MKIILTENQHSLMRRVGQVEDLIYPVMDMTYDFLTDGSPSYLNPREYDAFIDLISTKLAYDILNKEKNLEGDEKSKLLRQISQFVKNEYWDVIRKYFESRMNGNVNESTHDLKFKRRYEEIEEYVWDFILRHKLNSYYKFDDFLTELCWDVASDIVGKMNIPKDDYVTYRNQLIRFIKNNFYSELKEFWDRNTLNESFDLKSLQRRYQYISEFVDKALNEVDICIFSDVVEFVDRIVDYTADHIYESSLNLEWSNFDELNNFYQDIYDFISEHFVDRIDNFYENNKNICIDEDGNWINESENKDHIPSKILRRLTKFESELEITLRESDPCEYSRFKQYNRDVVGTTFRDFIDDENLELWEPVDFFNTRDFLVNTFEKKVREHYDAYSEMHCPDDPEIVNESIDEVMLRRRYEEIKSWVRADYNYLLDQGFSPKEAKEMTIDHSPLTYLDDEGNEFEWTGNNLDNLRDFIIDNFRDIIS